MLKYYFFYIFLFVTAGNTFGKDILFSSLGIKEGLSQLSVHSIYQDENGAIWFGTRQGLNRYDGNKIEQIPISPKPQDMADNTIWSIYGDGKGAIYLLADKSLLRYDLKSLSFETMTEGIVDHFYYHNQTIYLVSNNKVYLLDPLSKNLHLFATLESKYTLVKQMIISSQGAIWLGTNAGLIKLNRQGDIENVFFDDKQITAVKEDSQKSLWIGTKRQGAFRFNPHNETYSSVFKDQMDNEVRCFEEDENGEIWMGTFHGLYNIKPGTGEKIHYMPVEKMPNSLTHSSIYSIYKDVQGTIWIGTYFGGVNYFNPGKDFFRVYSPSVYHPNHLSFPIIGNMTEDSDGNIWICTEGGGLNRLNRKENTITIYQHFENVNSVSHNNLKYVWVDHPSNHLYIGTHLGGMSILDLASNKFTNFRHDPEDSNSLPNDVVNRMARYKDDLLMATQNGISSVNLNTRIISPFFKPIDNERDISKVSIWDILVDSKERLWIAYFTSGLVQYDLNSRKIKRYKYSTETLCFFPRFRIIEIFEDSKGRIFFATDGSGVLKYNDDTDCFTSYTAENNGLLSNYCFRMDESKRGDLIISSNKGITFLNIDNNHVRNLEVSKGLPISGIIEENGLFVAGDGEIFVGGTDGMVSFFEKDLEAMQSDYSIYFSKLFVNNHLVYPGDHNKILQQALNYTPEIVLKQGQTNVIFEYATSHYLRHTGLDYEYLLEGFDKNWIPAQSRSITYTNISPGNYTLKVREKNPGSIENRKEAQVIITVMPAWYASQLAYVVYFLLLISFLIGYIIFDRNRTLLKASLEFERKEKVRIEELNQSKLRFFTNISHEFRTPLTLIISQVELVIQNPSISQAALNQIAKIQKHAMRMRHMVNELLDFRKQEQGHLKLKVSKNDLVGFINEIALAFEDFALAREIRFIFENPGEALDVWFDPVQMQKVFYNLLSNAFKFTQPGDSVTISLIPKINSVVVKVIDSGKGIPVEELNRIFDRFYQAENIASDPAFVMSSGIGLALTKGIVELHGGSILVESSEGEGSTFRIELLLGDEHFLAEQKSTVASGEMKNLLNMVMPDKEFIGKLHAAGDSGSERPTILIVEDNEDIQQVLIELFEPLYTVITAGNGEEGFAKTLEIIPDIVLSDVMMAKMSGREMCRKIKSQYELSHIPVVLLTSQTTPEQISEGFMHGADDYITKPFDAKVLIIRCNNLVNGRRLLRERFSKMLSQTPVQLATNAADQEVLRKVDQVIEENLENTEFNIDILARETGMGRSKLYSTVRQVSGITPNTYILNFKMQRAVEWLKTSPQLTISEIAFKLGFNTARYFSLCFKDHYGMSPNEYRKKQQE
jgi:signal transduction histidine kinase/ligand-binding sensor domain-containing protein/DNA-binding response OmpR family regulator